MSISVDKVVGVGAYVLNSTFYQNKAVSGGSGWGGGLYVSLNTSGPYAEAFLINDTFFDNSSDDSGGGLNITLSDSMGQKERYSGVDESNRHGEHGCQR